jgi:hypothetical protein
MDIPISFILIIVFFDGAFEFGGISIFCGYVETNAKELCIKFCNFGQYHVFVSHLSFYCYI